MKIYSMIEQMKNSIRRETQLATQIIASEERYRQLSDQQLSAKTQEFRQRLQQGETEEDILVEAFAVVRETSSRVLGMRHFQVQLMGGIALHDGNLAEMKTGEGKTLAAVCPAYLNALCGKGVYVITVNEYLAARDCEEMSKIYEFLGLTVGLIVSGMSVEEKKYAYQCDITYGTGSEFGFDYLRDNMTLTKEAIMQRPPYYAIIDEIDSILIDEAGTPLIISGRSKVSADRYIEVDRFVKSLTENEDYEVDTEHRVATLTQSGMDRAEEVFGLEEYSSKDNVELIHHIAKALAANMVMKRDQDYAVIDDKVHIVDPFTGRILEGRRYTAGLHQAIEAKEEVPILKESSIMATITYQNYFKLFRKISGMTGTAYTQRSEFREIYGLNTVVIPTNRPTIREDREDLIFISESEKEQALFKDIHNRYQKGQPVLIGTIYIDQSEKISKTLKEMGIPHKLLNAKQDQEEAEIIALAGQKRAVTIATNMAGRGTDIKLGEGVRELGGLYIIGTQKHDSLRIDNQLRGRAGRQGDPGESVFYVSLDDPLFQRSGDHYHQKIKNLAQEMRADRELTEGEVLTDKAIVKAVISAQKNVEHINYTRRSNVVKFDAILNRQRNSIYEQRRRIIDYTGNKEIILTMIADVSKYIVDKYTKDSPYQESWDIAAMEEEFYGLLGVPEYPSIQDMPEEDRMSLSAQDILDVYQDYAQKQYELLYEMQGAPFMQKMEAVLLLSNIDVRWVQYLDIVEQMRQGIHLQAIGGIDPMIAFNKEAFRLFEEALQEMKYAVVQSLFELKKM